MESVREKVVLITGASSGIGAGTAVMFAKYGSRLALTGRNTANLEKTAEDCVKQGLARDKIVLITADLCQDTDVNKIITHTLEYFHKLDVLVNNAGLAIWKEIEEISMDEVDYNMTVNLRAVIALTKLAIPHLKATKGVILNVSSVNSTNASKPVYSATKAALDMFNSSLAVDLGRYGIRVNTVNPGHIKTEGVLKAFNTDECGKTMYPLGRIGEVEEVAHPIVFLASDAVSFITGANLFVDGGVAQTTSWYKPPE